MSLVGISNRADLTKKFRESRRRVEQISVPAARVEAYERVGWEVLSIGRTRVRLQRERSLADWVETQAWRVMYLCGFPHLSGDGGARLSRGEGVENQLDVVAYDEESALVIECKSSEGGASNVDVQAELAVLNEHRNSVRQELNRERGRDEKLKVGGILVLFDVPFSDADRRRADAMKLSIFDSSVLQYYERLAGVIGSAARFQLYGEVFQNQDIPTLSLKLPAVSFDLGGSRAYSFAIRPTDLLKISFVAHRGRGSMETYQRMVSKRRVKEIAHFIDEDGIFPTNIVINFQRQGERSRLRFDAASQDENATPGSRLGYLTIPPIYQAAWIIDGQHRLLAYCDHRRAATASLVVTAFDGLGADTQAELFEKINSKQKKVSANLLVELFSTLHWNSRDPKLQVRAIASQVAQDLRSRPQNPLFRRVLSPDEKATTLRCITLTELVTGLQRPGMFVRLEERGAVRQFGVLWTGSPDTSHARAMSIVSAWLEFIRDACADMWDAGNDENMGLVATNRGINASLRALGWVLMHLQRRQADFDGQADQLIIDAIEPFGRLVGAFFNTLSADEIRSFRRHYGTGAAAEIAYSIGRAVLASHPEFEPEGLLDWIESKSRVDVDEAQSLSTDIERRLISGIVSRMKREYGEDGWWREVPVSIRREAAARREEEDEDHPVETFLYLIDLRTIVESKWPLFQNSYSIGAGTKNDRTKWLVRFNDVRRRAAHAGGVRLRAEDIDLLREINATLSDRGI